MKHTPDILRNTNYRFIKMKKPLTYPVYCNTKVVIPAGAEDVEISFRSSPLYRIDENGRRQHLNVYRYNGVIYHG